MSVSYEILFFSLLLFVGIVLNALFRRVHIPASLWFLLVGFVGAQWVTTAGYDIGLRWYHFREIAFYMILPALVFTAALQLNLRSILQNLMSLAILSLPVFFIMLFLNAALLFDGINFPSGFPWIAAFLTATILSATDPEDILFFCEKFKVPERLILLIKGESLFNDAGAIVIYGIVMTMAGGGEAHWLTDNLFWRFLIIFFGGILTGLAAGLLIWGLFYFVKRTIERYLLVFIIVYTSFIVAETIINVSGVMALVAAGLIINNIYSRFDKEGTLLPFWSFFAYLVHALIMILVGITVTLSMFLERWYAMLLGIVAIIAARAIGIYGIYPLFNFISRQKRIDSSFRHVLFWGSNRGAIAVALALSLPLSLEYWFTIQSITYGVVLFGLIVQAGLFPYLIRRLFPQDAKPQ